MNQSKKKSVYIACFSIAVFLGLLFYSFPDDGYDPVEGRLADAFHVPMGVALSLVFMWAFDGIVVPVNRLAAFVFVGCAILGGVSEIIQPYFGRGESIYDWSFGLMGLVIGICFYYLLSNKVKRSDVWVGWLIGSVMLQSIALIPAGRVYMLVRKQEQMFPKFTDFSSERELSLWKPISEKGKIHLRISESEFGKYLSLSGNGRGFFGAEIALPDKPWTDFTKLHLDLINTESSEQSPSVRHVMLRIDDCHDSKEYDSRYNGHIAISAGLSEISISLDSIVHAPRARELDLSCIQRMVIFTKARDENFSFGIGNIWLE